MTNVAVVTKATIVDIVAAVTAIAFTRKRLIRRHRLRMAIVATSQSVRASQLEPRCSLVLKEPVLPRSRVMAGVAAFAEAKLMRIIINVAGDTIGAGIMEGGRLMTGCALQFRVLTD